MANLLERIGNIKSRALLVVVLAVIVVAAGAIWFGTRSAPSVLETSQSSTKRISPGMESLPGAGEANIVYDPLVALANEEKAKEALAGSRSAVPTLINPAAGGYGREGFGTFGERCGEECYDEHGYDQEGYNRDGYNAMGYDRNGYDPNGYDQNGFDKQGYDKNGFDKHGYDRFGYDKDGFDRNGCNRQGFDRQGKPCTSALGADCFNKEGLDANGCNRDGLDPQGNMCYNTEGFNANGFDKCGFDKNGFNKDGYDKDGFDKDGYDRDGFDRNGCNREGLNRAGKSCYDAKGYTEEGLDRQGYDKNGYNKDGLDRQGYDKDGYDKDGFNRAGCNRQGLDRQGNPCGANAANLNPLFSALTPGGPSNINPAQNAESEYQRLMAEQQKLQAERNAELTAEQHAQALADQQARLAAYENLMNSQAQAILQAWAPPTQVYVKGMNPPEAEIPVTQAGPVNGLPPSGQGPILYKAGDMLFAVVDTAINSDDPGPVLARVVSEGPLKGARIMGTFQRQDQVLFVRFNVLSLAEVPQSIAIDAVAVDPETSRTSVATSVDNHTLEKYGTIIAASFLQGMGEAVETSLGTPTLSSDGSATIASQVPATSRDQVIVGLGKVGQAIGDDLEKRDIQPTVTLDSGTGVGLLLMADLRIEQPEEPLRVEAPLAPGEKPAPKTPAAPVKTAANTRLSKDRTLTSSEGGALGGYQ